jgi:hypothetical protein
MQIIINRIALIAEHRSTVAKLKWGTVAFITSINVAVFIIWIPSHIVPPVSQTFVNINNVWDKVSKVLILIVDAGLNWYFLRTVNQRLVKQHGLTKYKPLVGFNAKLMVLSVALDVSQTDINSLLHINCMLIHYHSSSLSDSCSSRIKSSTFRSILSSTLSNSISKCPWPHWWCVSHEESQKTTCIRKRSSTHPTRSHRHCARVTIHIFSRCNCSRSEAKMTCLVEMTARRA